MRPMGNGQAWDHKSTPNDVFLKSECVYVSEPCLPNAPRGSI